MTIVWSKTDQTQLRTKSAQQRLDVPEDSTPSESLGNL